MTGHNPEKIQHNSLWRTSFLNRLTLILENVPYISPSGINSANDWKNTAWETTKNHHHLFSQLHLPKNLIRQRCHASKLGQ